jgi:hypothetical protein
LDESEAGEAEEDGGELVALKGFSYRIGTDVPSL